MGRHVPPHRWADAQAGQIASVQLAAMEEHAEECSRCARVRDRVRATWDAFADIRDASTPRLDWEHIGARIYWQTSSERRAATRRPARRWPGRRWLAYGAIAAVGAAAGVAGLWLWPGSGSGSGDSSAVADRATGVEEVEKAAGEPDVMPVELITEEQGEPLEGLVTFSQGDVWLDGEPLALDGAVRAGARLQTGEGGRLTVQLGERSGFTLGPDSSVELASFDSRSVELALEGDVAVDLTRRPDGQSFEVVAGDHVVSVRGTVFEVGHRDGALSVACARGRVAVRGADIEKEVAAGQLLLLSAGETLAMRRPMSLDEVARERLEREVRVRMLPAWTDAELLRETSSVLRLQSSADRAVEVDGEPVARGPFRMRVMPGRHHVAEVGESGRWVEAEAGDAIDTAPTEADAEAKAGAVRTRRGQLDRSLDRGRARACLRSLEKHGLLEGSFVVFDIGVNADGTLGHLNIARTNMPRESATCIRSLVEAARLPSGPNATLRYRVVF